MKVKFYLITNFFIWLLLMAIGCTDKKSLVNFSQVCLQQDQTKIQIEGFLIFPKTTTTPNLPQNDLLLVENNNGTGGFIKINYADAEIKQIKNKVKIFGKVIKDEKGCVLKVEEIETP